MGDDVLSQRPLHAFNHAPAALRIFRFAADSASRVLEITHLTKFLRECAVEFGSADATLPGALRCDYTSGRYFELRAVVESNAARCPWLAGKLLAYRSGAPMPAAALAPDVTRHDVNWGAEGARRTAAMQLTHTGFGVSLARDTGSDFCHFWAQGPIGVTSGKHYFQVSVIAGRGGLSVGWLDNKLSASDFDDFIGKHGSGAAYDCGGRFCFGTAPQRHPAFIAPAPTHARPCVLGCLPV